MSRRFGIGWCAFGQLKKPPDETRLCAGDSLPWKEERRDGPPFRTQQFSMRCKELRPAPARVAETPTYDGAVTQLIETNSGDLLLFYHQSDIGHTAPDGRVVLRRSTDRGETWTEPRIIHDEPGQDILNLSVVYDPDTGRACLFDVAAGFSETVELTEKLPRSGLHIVPWKR